MRLRLLLEAEVERGHLPELGEVVGREGGGAEEGEVVVERGEDVFVVGCPSTFASVERGRRGGGKGRTVALAGEVTCYA